MSVSIVSGIKKKIGVNKETTLSYAVRHLPI